MAGMVEERIQHFLCLVVGVASLGIGEADEVHGVPERKTALGDGNYRIAILEEVSLAVSFECKDGVGR
jgi:hypothetical protein